VLGLGLVSCQLTPGDPRSWTDIYSEALRITEEAERLGFERIWTTEHHFVDDGYMPSLLVMGAAMAARTSTIKIGTGVLLAPLHHPLRLAEDAATVALLSKDRLELGLGLGWSPIEFEGMGADTKVRGKAMDEILAILSQAWSGDPIIHHGTVYDLPEVGIRPAPAKPVPVFIGGGADAAVKRAARAADGFFSNASPARFAHQVEVAQTEMAAAGRDPDSFAWDYYNYVFPCDDPDVGWEEIKEHLWLSRWKYDDMGPSASRSGGPQAPPPMGADDEASLRKMALIGTGRHIADQVNQLREEIGIDFAFTARSYYPGLSLERQLEVMEQLAAEVLPEI